METVTPKLNMEDVKALLFEVEISVKCDPCGRECEHTARTREGAVKLALEEGWKWGTRTAKGYLPIICPSCQEKERKIAAADKQLKKCAACGQVVNALLARRR